MRGWKPYVLTGVALGAIVVIASVLYFTVFTVSVTVAERRMRVRTGTTVGDLWGRGLIDARPGDLLSAKNRSVLKAQGGRPAVMLVNSQPAPSSQKLHGGDIAAARNGADVVEKISRRSEAIPFDTRIQGIGPVETMVTTGSPGAIEVLYGAVSHAVVSTSVVSAPVIRVVRRSQPGPGAKLIALTFDDGPWPKQTRAVLRILVTNNVRATFFMIGKQARANPSTTRAVTRAGMLIGNHTEKHLYASKLTTAQVTAEIEVAERHITASSGQRPRFFRPAGGTVVPAMSKILARSSLRLVMWDVDPKDWKRPYTKTIVRRVVSKARPGAVILMHDGGGDRSRTIAALPTIIKTLKAKGYVFVTLDALKSLPSRMH